MDDKSRHLEKLAQNIRRLTLVEVQKKFLLGDVQGGTDLLSLWEDYIALTKPETQSKTQETFSSTIVLYRKRVGALQSILNILPNQQCVVDLQEQLQFLETKFASTKFGIGGGTFEWVDSILVKCLQEGSWLVVDNVNLCSPAVLDRLNGLLEPGGELVVGERGVGPGGELVTIKPHPDFRLFMLMDPIHGEISRAMRNRGVELCLLNTEEKAAHHLDLRAILNHIGVSRYSYQKALLIVHQQMVDLAIGFEGLTPNHLLQVASLTMEQVVRGQPFLSALKSAASDVYIQSRQLTFDQKERSSRVLDSILEDQEKLLLISDSDAQDALDTDVVTLRTSSLQENSALALMRQKCALFSTSLHLINQNQDCTLKQLLGDDQIVFGEEDFAHNVSEIIEQIFLTTVSSLSPIDLSSRQIFISRMITTCKNIEIQKKLKKLEDCFIKSLHEAVDSNCLNIFDKVNRQDLCWDLRRVSPWIVDVDSCDFENKVIALLYYLKQSSDLDLKLDKIKTSTVKNMSVLEFSTAYNRGKVTVASVKSELILGLSRFLESLNSQIVQVTESSAGLDSQQCCQLICAWQWVLRLSRVAQRKLFIAGARDMRVCDQLVTLLALHVSWTKKWLFPQLTRLLIKHSKRKESGKLPMELTELCRDLTQISPLRSLSKKVRALNGQPLPLNNHIQGQVLDTISRIEDILDLRTNDKRTELIKKRVEFLLTDEGKQFMRSFILLVSQAVQNNSDLQEVLDKLKQLETGIGDKDLSKSTQHLIPRKNSAYVNWEVPVWVLRGVVCLRMMSAVLSSTSDQLIDCLTAWSKSLPLVPARVSAVLDNITDNHLTAVNLLTTQLSRSPILTSPRVWLSWPSLYEKTDADSMEIDLLEDIDSKNERYPLHSPLMAVFTTSLLHPGIHELGDFHSHCPSLRHHKRQTELLQSLQEIIWSCGPGLSSSSLSYRKNESNSFQNSYQEFVKAMQTVVQSKLVNKELTMNERNLFTTLSEVLNRKSEVDQNSGLSPEVKEFLNDVAKHLEQLDHTVRKLEYQLSDGDFWLIVGEGWSHLGLLQLKLFSHQAQVDPVQVNSLKVEYCQQEQKELQESLAVERGHGLLLGSFRFPLAEAFNKRVQELQTKEQKLKKFVAQRPQPNVYANLYNEIQQLMAVVVTGGRRVETAVSSLARQSSGKEIEMAVAQAQSLLISLHMSTDSMNNKYGTWYPDVTVPVVSALTKLTHGLSLMIGGVKSQQVNSTITVEPLLRSLVQFPLPDCSSGLNTVETCTSSQLLDLFLATVKTKLKPGETPTDETFRLAKCSLEELGNVLSVQGGIKGDKDWKMVCDILNHLMKVWTAQEHTRSQQEQQDASFFINKTRKIENLTEEEEDTMEMRKLFPSYREKDFADLEPPSLEQKKVPIDIPVADDKNLKLTEENIIEIHRVHSSIVTQNTITHWIQPNNQTLLNFTNPFLDRFTIFSVLLDALYEGCESELDSIAIPALCLATRLGKESQPTYSEKKHYDFYHDSNVSESKLCVPILESLTKRVSELLDEWPDHPTLNQIMMVMNRILGFPSSSPLSRFLVGLELLLTKLKEWEENAHAGVTLAPHAAVVTRQILDWRKLELSQWKGCFESSRNRVKQKVVSKWWFHLYSLTQEYAENSSELGTVLEQFMESSTLGEYQDRLDLLYVFHCHAVNNKLEMQSSVLWNIHQYYSQFSHVVSRRIRELSLPVEKKLKDFVKIARWNDINYWAVKETVDKTHRTLFKYIREYEGILKEHARSAMTKLDPIGRIHFELPADFSPYIAPMNLVEKVAEPVEGDGLLSRGKSLFLRSRKLCQESIQSCRLPQDIEALQMVIDELKDITELLNTEDVDRTVSKEKQKSAAKSVLHRKRKALTDLFHTLAALGLSYRAGLIKTEDVQFTTHAPLNVKAGLEQIDTKLCDKDLKQAWAGCDQLFLHSVAFSAQLKATLSKPHKDLGPAVIERCRGFTNHLMTFCHNQKKSVTNSATSLYNLRCLTQCLASLIPLVPGVDPANIKNIKNELISTVDDTTYCLTQFDILMDSCPASPDIIIVEQRTELQLPESSEYTISYGDEHWTQIKTHVASAIKSSKHIKSLLEESGKYSKFLEKSFKSETSGFEVLLSLETLKSLKEGYQQLPKIISDIAHIQKQFRIKNGSDVNPLTLSLNHLTRKIESIQEKFNLVAEVINNLTEISDTSKHPKEDSSEESVLVESFLNKILISIQEFYKRNTQSNSVAEGDSNNENENILADSHLKEKVIKELQTEMDLLNIKDVLSDLQHLLMRCKDSTIENSLIKSMKLCLPVLEQYNLLVQYLTTLQISALRTSSQLSSQLLGLFIDLANKGFRVPEELLEEEGEGGETSAGGLGLGEGEGEKDVSDQIESKDQLEDAKKPGEHDKEEDKDCKEEEKGIDMTDDFGGKLQDIEEKADSDGSGDESAEEEEPDKEMGETEKGAETLDDQIWGGSDSENEEEEESSDLKEEEGDRGEQMGDKEMGAKDENKTPQGDEDDRHGEEDKKDKKKEINEMEEPEVDDDQIDPYHGKHQPQPEPEPLELPDDLQLDDGEGNDKDEDKEEENPFDIDAMKEPKLPEEEEPSEENGEMKENEDGKGNEPEADSSSDEEETGEGQGENLNEDMDVDEEEKPDEEDNTAESGGAKDENKTGEEEKMEEDKKEEKEEAKPSEDTPASQAVPKSEQEAGSKDQVDQPETGEQSNELRPEDSPAEGPDQQGVGAASDKQQQEAQKGSKGDSRQAVESQANEMKEEKRQRPGDSEEQRALGDVHEPMKKKLKTINMQKENEMAEEEKENGIEEDQTAELYQHIKEAKNSAGDAQTLDAATEEQAAKQEVPNKEDEEASQLEDDKDMTMDLDEPQPEMENVSNVNPEKMKESQNKDKEGAKQASADGERGDTDTGMEVEGEIVETMTVARGGESTFHTRLDVLPQDMQNIGSVDDVREQLEQQLASWSQPPATEEAARAWERLSMVTSDLSRELSEQLRLVLEPTHASRLKGDFRTGRRINMRKVIPYIASQFRKDKIWLRRTKPAKREYQIILAIDDSSSMADNHSKELAFESLAVVSKALNLLEAGQLSVLSFGEQPKILHQLGDTFTEQSGARLLQQFSFEQQKTQVGALVNFACGVFSRNPGRRGVSDVAQLLVIVSDGRGVMNDGEEVVRQAVRRAKHMGVFMVFLIVDNPLSKDSILDIRLPKFSGGKLMGIVPYMDSFPFPFYLILRDINSLPSVLSDALRQWFELVTAS